MITKGDASRERRASGSSGSLSGAGSIISDSGRQGSLRRLGTNHALLSPPTAVLVLASSFTTPVFL